MPSVCSSAVHSSAEARVSDIWVQPDTPPFVYQLRNTGRSYTKSQLKMRLAAQALVVLCMTPEYSESDTQDFVKSCVSYFEIDMSIHKSDA